MYAHARQTIGVVSRKVEVTIDEVNQSAFGDVRAIIHYDNILDLIVNRLYTSLTIPYLTIA